MSPRLGLGTYRRSDVAQAAAMAATAGCDWGDTAPNYENGRAEASLAPVLAVYPNVKVSTKVVFIPPAARRAALRAGALSDRHAERGHSLAPSYVAWQTARSSRMLGRMPYPVFVHKPEHDCGGDQIADRLHGASLALEDACAQGLIDGTAWPPGAASAAVC